MARYARGKHSYGIDDRSGFKVRYSKLKKQWDGFRVADPDFEAKHPLITPVRVLIDAGALQDPRGDPDIAVQYTISTTTENAIYPTTNATTYPNYSTHTATTQLWEAIDVTFGGSDMYHSPTNTSFPTQTGNNG